MGLTAKTIASGAKTAVNVVSDGAKSVASSAGKKMTASRMSRIALGSLAGAGAGGIAGVATGADEDSMKAMVIGGAVAGGIGGAVSTMGMNKNLEVAGQIAGEGHVGSGFAPLKNIRVKNTGEMLGDIALVEERASGQIAMDLGQFDKISNPIPGMKESLANKIDDATIKAKEIYGGHIKKANENFATLGDINIGMQNDGQLRMLL